MKVLAKVYVTLKASVLDPQGTAVLRALHALRHDSVKDVRIGKYMELWLEAPDEASARGQVEAMCAELLTNPVIEQYSYELAEAGQ